LTETVKFAVCTPAVKLPDRDNQLTVVQVCSDTLGVAVVLVCAVVTVRVCEAGAAAPATALKARAEELSVSPEAVGAVTFRVTVAVCVPEAVLMEIVPVQVVPAVIPD
jgi:hypothetical protein